MSSFDAALAFTIGYGVPGFGWEGGEADNPADPGGFTWRGITLRYYRDFVRDQTFSEGALLALSEDAIVAYYGCNYWNAVCGNQLPSALALMVFDFGVTAGPGTAARVLQSCLGVTVDGSIGPETLAAANAGPLPALLQALHDAQIASYQQDADWPTFGSGWTNRTNDRLATALHISASS